jgi:hypothetical protein
LQEETVFVSEDNKCDKKKMNSNSQQSSTQQVKNHCSGATSRAVARIAISASLLAQLQQRSLSMLPPFRASNVVCSEGTSEVIGSLAAFFADFAGLRGIHGIFEYRFQL